MRESESARVREREEIDRKKMLKVKSESKGQFTCMRFYFVIHPNVMLAKGKKPSDLKGGATFISSPFVVIYLPDPIFLPKQHLVAIFKVNYILALKY